MPMNRWKLLIALVVAGGLTAGLGSTVVPASAQQFQITVKLPTGGTTTLTIEAGGCPSSVALGPVVACVPIGVAVTPPQQATPPPAPTQASAQPAPPSSAGGEPGKAPSARDKPGRQPTSGGAAKGEDAKGDDDGSTEGSSVDPDLVPGAGKPEKDGRGEPITQADGQPALSNPTVTIADIGPAPIGVPNFLIDRFRIPPFLLPIYQAAEAQYNIPWQILAAINEIETDYGRNLNVSSAGAMGWMQFIPSTWKAYGTDANNDGRRDPYNPVDAIFAAARYVKAAGGEKDIRKGLFAYNNANWYVDSVLLRAKVIGGLSSAVVGSLTQMVEGRFPVAARARYADQLSERETTRRVARSKNASIPVASKGDRESIDIFSRKGAPVIAVNDGEIVETGQSKKLGRFVVLKDYSGNRYTYSQLGSVVGSYPAPKEKKVSQEEIRDELNLPKDPKPTLPASAGAQRPKPGSKSPSRKPAGKPTGKPARPAPKKAAGPVVNVTKERLYANPTRPTAYRNGGQEQVAATSGKKDFETYGAYFARVFGLGRDDVEFKPLKKGAQVRAGTVLGRLGTPVEGKAPYVTFVIQPSGKGTPLIDPKPILDGWKLLESTAIYRAAGKNPFVTQKTVSVGQMLLMTKEQLGKSVLSDPRVDIYECGRDDIKAGLIDKRVLITMKYLAGSGLRPTVSSLKCGHSKYTAGGGRISDHWYGRAVDIAAVNGISILGNQQDGGIADITIRKLLELKGSLKPSQIISLRTYQGADNTLALPDHDDHIHIGFGSQPGRGNPGDDAVLKPSQWLKLIDRLGEIDNPTVPIKPSKSAIPEDPTGRRKDD